MNVESQRQKLRWKRKPFPELARLAWPIVVSMLSYSVMTLVDTLFVGRLGASALAAVGLGGITAFTVLCFGFGLLRGEKILVSQAAGAGRPGRIAAFRGAAIVLAIAIGVLAAIVGQLFALYLPYLTTERHSGELARVYVSIRVSGAPLVLIAVALREARYAIGDSRAPMRAALVANLINLPLNAWLIFGLELGVAGAAWASVAAQAIEVLVLAQVQRPEGFGLREWRRADVVALWRVGAPVGLERLLDVGSFSLLVLLIARMGRADLAAHHIAVQVWHFSVLPAIAIGEATSVLVGQAVGADEDRLVPKVAKSGLVLTTTYMLLCSAVFVGFGPTIVAWFTEDGAVRATAVRLLYAASVFQLFSGLYFVSNGALKGAGDVRFAAFVAVGAAWAFTPPLTALFGHVVGLGALGGWLALGTEIGAASFILTARLARGGWLAAAQASRRRIAAENSDPALAPEPATS